MAIPTQNQDDTAQRVDKLEQMMEKLLEEQNAPAAVSQMSPRSNGRPYKKPQQCYRCGHYGRYCRTQKRFQCGRIGHTKERCSENAKGLRGGSVNQ